MKNVTLLSRYRTIFFGSTFGTTGLYSLVSVLLSTYEYREMMRFLSSLSSIFCFGWLLVKLPVKLWPFSSRSNIIWMAISTSPFAIVMQCFISNSELSGNISCSATLSSTKKSHVVKFSFELFISLKRSSFPSLLSEMDFVRSFGSGMMSDNRSDLYW